MKKREKGEKLKRKKTKTKRWKKDKST